VTTRAADPGSSAVPAPCPACSVITARAMSAHSSPGRACIWPAGSVQPWRPGPPWRRPGPHRRAASRAPVKLAASRRHDDVLAVLAGADVRNAGGNHPGGDDDTGRDPGQTVEAARAGAGTAATVTATNRLPVTEGGDKDADRYRRAAMRRCGAMTRLPSMSGEATSRPRHDRAVGRRAQRRGAWQRLIDGPAAGAPVRPPGLWSCHEPGRRWPARASAGPAAPGGVRQDPEITDERGGRVRS
jgi:hypothetical protein